MQNENESGGVNRRHFLELAALGSALALAKPLTAVAKTSSAASVTPELEEITLSELQDGMASGRWTARSIAEGYLGRIDALDKRGPAINAIIELNPEALAIADAMDHERKAGHVRGPLHGTPVVIKDNIDTADRMATSAGSLALAENHAARDAFVAARLREAGAVILGKTNLSEWANFRSTHSTSGWSGRGGLTKNPYVLDRNACGSSSGTGSAIAANLAAIGIGTETDGSVVCPSSASGLVGIKPTLGLISRAGIIPIAHSQDTSGPMARTVRDAAILLGVLTGADERDPVTVSSRTKGHSDYTRFLDAGGLKGARIGVARQYFGFNDATDKLMKDAIELIKSLGATIVDPANIKTNGKFDATENDVLQYEFKTDLNTYLAGAPAAVKSRTLADLIKFNEEHRAQEMPFFGQEIFEQSEKRGPLTDKKYRDALAKNHRLARTEGIDATMAKHKVDAIIAPTGGPVWATDLVNGDHFTGGYSSASAVAGYPHITVPAGLAFGLPVGLSFFGGAWSEPALIKFAYAFEQGSKARQKPRFLPTAV
ncbi:MAG TPA: amidase [Thermoanaerobaculia bacterium]|jgi:amidase|nr:amidase [Thermoanaerobaculia bacterium]